MVKLNLLNLLKKGNDIVKAFVARSFDKLGVCLGFVSLILGQQFNIVNKIPLFFERKARLDFDVVYLVFAFILKGSVDHTRVVKFLIRNLVYNVGNRLLSVVSCPVFNKFITRARLTFGRIRTGKVKICLTVF